MAEPVADIHDPALQTIIADMYETMAAANDVGPAAPQIGINLQLMIFGFKTFILSGYPHLEEACRTAELLFPHLDTASASPQRSPVSPGRAGEAGGYALNRYGSDVATGPS